MKNIKNTLRYSLYLLLATCIFYDAKAQQLSQTEELYKYSTLLLLEKYKLECISNETHETIVISSLCQKRASDEIECIFNDLKDNQKMTWHLKETPKTFRGIFTYEITIRTHKEPTLKDFERWIDCQN